MRGWKIAVALTVTAMPSIAAADPASTPPCPAEAAPLPVELAGWSARKPATAASTPGGLAKAALQIGSAVDATLSPAADTKYVVAPEKPGAPDNHGGLFAFDVAEAGTYRVALGSAAWVDVVEGNQAVTSTAHGHGPACSGIRKIVDFPLKAGRHVLQVAGSASPTIAVMVTRLP